MAKTRNSSVELLRILCIFGIIFMHTIAYGGNELSETNRYLLIFTNCITNLGVTCFMLISGYYGIRLQLDKLIRLDLMTIFYTALHQIIKLALGVPVGKTDLLCTVFPILSNQYWYLTAYFIIALLSGAFNRAAERLGKEGLLKLLLILLTVFCVAPTVLHFDILGSEGKNVVQMTIIYLLGRYLRLYRERTYDAVRLAILLGMNLLVTFALEMALYAVTGHYSMFYRDCSVFTIVSASLLFRIFQGMYFENKAVDKIAGCVLAVYVFSFGFQKLVYLLLPLEDYAFSPLLFPLICVFAPCVVSGCVVTELLRQAVFGRLEERVSVFLEKKLRNLWQKAKGCVEDAGKRLDDYAERKETK